MHKKTKKTFHPLLFGFPYRWSSISYLSPMINLYILTNDLPQTFALHKKINFVGYSKNAIIALININKLVYYLLLKLLFVL